MISYYWLQVVADKGVGLLSLTFSFSLLVSSILYFNLCIHFLLSFCESFFFSLSKRKKKEVYAFCVSRSNQYLLLFLRLRRNCSRFIFLLNVTMCFHLLVQFFERNWICFSSCKIPKAVILMPHHYFVCFNASITQSSKFQELSFMCSIIILCILILLATETMIYIFITAHC